MYDCLERLWASWNLDAFPTENVTRISNLRPFYYNKYYKKTFNVKHYGVETNLALLSYIKDQLESQLRHVGWQKIGGWLLSQ